MLANHYIYILIFFQAASCTFVLSPFCYPLARKVGAIDIPRDSRRMHNVPIPRIGGFAIFFSFIFNFSFFAKYDEYMNLLFIGGLIIVLTGICDDSFGLKPKTKFFLQIFSAVIPVIFGIYLPFFEKSSVVISMVITIFFIVALENSFNLIDGVDGLCGKTAIYACTSLFLISIITQNIQSSILSLIIAGCTFGFLPFNLYSPKQFLGDTGALFLGFSLSICSLMTVKNLNTNICLPILLLVFAYPFAEVSSSFLRRIIKSQNPFSPDRNHIHHKLIDFGYTPKEVSNILSLSSLIFGLWAFILCLIYI